MSSGNLSRNTRRVPQANPFGIGQFRQGKLLGRFHEATGQNFNRAFDHSLAMERPASNLAQWQKSLVQLAADIAVRMVRPSQEQLLARRVGLIEVGLHARDDYLHERGIPVQMQDLVGHSVIGFDQENAFIRSLAIKGFERSAFAISSDSDLAQ